MAQKQSHCGACCRPGFEPHPNSNLHFFVGLVLRAMVGQNLYGLFLLQNIPGLNIESHPNAFVVQANAQLIAIRKSDENVKPGGTLVVSVRVG